MSEIKSSLLGEGVKAEIKALIKEAVEEAIGQNGYGEEDAVLPLAAALPVVGLLGVGDADGIHASLSRRT